MMIHIAATTTDSGQTLVVVVVAELLLLLLSVVIRHLHTVDARPSGVVAGYLPPPFYEKTTIQDICLCWLGS